MAYRRRRRRRAARRQFPDPRPQGRSQEPHLPDPAQRRGPREQGARRTRRAAGARRRRPGPAGADRGARADASGRGRHPRRPSRCRSCSRTTRSLSSTSRPGWRSTAAAGSPPGSSSRCAPRGPTRAFSSSSTGSTATRRASCCSRRKRSALVALHEQLREAAFDKRYVVLVRGRWRDEKRRVRLPLRSASTREGERACARGAGRAGRGDGLPPPRLGPTTIRRSRCSRRSC